MRIVTLCFFIFLSNLATADTIPLWKVFHNSKLIKEIKFSDTTEEIKINILTSKQEDYLAIVYDSFKNDENFTYDILVESETAVDLNIKYKNEDAKLQTESNVELYYGRINNKVKPIRIDFEWLIDWLKEYPQYRIQVILIETNRKENKYKSTKLFYIVNE